MASSPSSAQQLHMKLLLHASECKNEHCPSANCAKMKALLRHGAQCTQRATNGCPTCKRIWELLQLHAQQCQLTDGCPVPRCSDLKAHYSSTPSSSISSSSTTTTTSSSSSSSSSTTTTTEPRTRSEVRRESKRIRAVRVSGGIFRMLPRKSVVDVLLFFTIHNVARYKRLVCHEFRDAGQDRINERQGETLYEESQRFFLGLDFQQLDKRRAKLLIQAAAQVGCYTALRMTSFNNTLKHVRVWHKITKKHLKLAPSTARPQNWPVNDQQENCCVQMFADATTTTKLKKKIKSWHRFYSVVNHEPNSTSLPHSRCSNPPNFGPSEYWEGKKVCEQCHDMEKRIFLKKEQELIRFKEIATISSSKHKTAAFYVAECYFLLGKQIQPNKAIEWLEIAIQRGSTVARARLGSMHLRDANEYVEHSRDKAIEHLTLAANKGNALARYYLGQCVEVTLADGSTHHRRSLNDVSSSSSQLCRGPLHRRLAAELIPRDNCTRVEGYQWLVKSAEQGRAEAQQMVAHIIDQKSTRNERIAKIIPEMLIRDSLHGTLIPMTQRIVSSSDVIEFRNEPWHYSERLSWERMQARTCYLWTQACAKQGNKKCQFTLAKHFSNHFKNEDEEYKHGWERMEQTDGGKTKVYFWNWDSRKAVWKRPVDYSTDEDANEEVDISGCLGQFNCSLQKAYRESKSLEWYQKAAAQGLPEALEAVAQLSSTQSLVIPPECSCKRPGPPPPPDCSCKQYNLECSCTSRFTCHGGRTMAEEMIFRCPNLRKDYFKRVKRRFNPCPRRPMRDDPMTHEETYPDGCEDENCIICYEPCEPHGFYDDENCTMCYEEEDRKGTER